MAVDVAVEDTEGDTDRVVVSDAVGDDDTVKVIVGDKDGDTEPVKVIVAVVLYVNVLIVCVECVGERVGVGVSVKVDRVGVGLLVGV